MPWLHCLSGYKYSSIFQKVKTFFYFSLKFSLLSLFGAGSRFVSLTFVKTSAWVHLVPGFSALWCCSCTWRGCIMHCVRGGCITAGECTRARMYAPVYMRGCIRVRVRMRACARVRVCVCVCAHYASVENCPLGVRRKLPAPMMGSSKIALYVRVENCMRPIRVRRKCAYTGVTKIASAYECALENQAYTCASKIDFFYFSKAKF